VGITGPKKTAIEIKNRIRNYLAENLKLELNVEKINIIHMTRERVFFLGV